MALRVRTPLLLVLVAVLIAWTVPLSSCAEGPAVVAPKPAVDLPRGQPGELRTAVLAGGCFWCVEAAFAQLDGVTGVVSGYAGGTAETATYEKYHDGDHAEVVRITYDAAKIGFAELIQVLFTAGDPTTKDGQHPDYGRGYRMAVFVADAEQRRVAEAYLRQVDEAKLYAKPIAVTVEAMPLGFFAAEDYHQDYVVKHPDHPYVKRWSVPKIAKLRAAFPDRVKPTDQTPPNR